MKHLRLKSTFLAFLFTATAALAADPTLPETITYITDKLNNLPPASWHGEGGRYDMCGMKVEWFTNGTLSIVATRHRPGVGGQPEEEAMRYQLPLSTLSTEVTIVPAGSAAVGAAPEAFGIVLCSATDANTPQGTIYVQEDGGMMRISKKVTLWFKSQDTAQHVAQAFAHAIELSGGKKDPFGN